jgi:two-component system NtrC family sensor kinase
MKPKSLRTQISGSFLLLILLLGLGFFIFGLVLIRVNVIERAQQQVATNLQAARSVWEGELDVMAKALDLVADTAVTDRIKSRLGLDYLCVAHLPAGDAPLSPLVARALCGTAAGGLRIIDRPELVAMGAQLAARARIEVHQTPRARATQRAGLTGALALEYAVPLRTPAGQVRAVLYGGKIINRDFALVDRIRDVVYGGKLYKGKPLGRVTVFQDDVRIATNVRTDEGRRAVGTRVAPQVYAKVVEGGQAWYARAFAISEWYLTAYEPLRDFDGRIVGMLSLGIMERPFNDIIRSSLIAFVLILAGCSALAIGVSLLLAGRIARPLTRQVDASARLAAGELSCRVPGESRIAELQELALAFNEMAKKIDERDSSLMQANAELDKLNKRYIDLVGIVSHELKGALASTILNAYSVADGYLGELNPVQKKALDAVCRSLEHFDLSVKNFLNLSRVEKGELALQARRLRLREEVVDIAIDAFSRQAAERGISVDNRIGAEVELHADPFLLLTVVNNCIGNAIKYGAPQGAVTVALRRGAGAVTVEVYNDGRPFTESECGRLFQRFSRLDGAESRRQHGTGLGLFLSREIVQRHGGRMWCEPRESGNAFLFSIPLTPRSAASDGADAAGRPGAR